MKILFNKDDKDKNYKNVNNVNIINYLIRFLFIYKYTLI